MRAEDGDLFHPPAFQDRGAPSVGETTPARWRGCAAAILARRWRDLYAWVEWLFAAFDVEISRVEEGFWWRSGGAVEELSALREWHRELVDVVIPTPRPPDDVGREAAIAFERKERAMRAAVAAELVSWHQARASVSQRLFNPASRPLLVRRTEQDAIGEWSEQCSCARKEEFDRFLRELRTTSGDPAAVPAAAADGTSETRAPISAWVTEPDVTASAAEQARQRDVASHWEEEARDLHRLRVPKITESSEGEPPSERRGSPSVRLE